MILYHIQSTESTIFCNFCMQNCEVVFFHNTRQGHPPSFVQVAQFDISRRISIGDFLKKHLFSLSLHARQLRTNMHRFCTFMSFAHQKRRLRPLHLQQSGYPSCILQDDSQKLSPQEYSPAALAKNSGIRYNRIIRNGLRAAPRHRESRNGPGPFPTSLLYSKEQYYVCL